MDRRRFLASGLATVGSALAGCAASPNVESYDIGMISGDFLPQSTISVPNSAPAWVPRDIPTFETTVGTPVVWLNTGSREHTVTAATREHEQATALLGHPEADHPGPRLPAGVSFFGSGGFDSEVSAVKSFIRNVNGGGVIPPGARYTHIFEKEGWYHYYCIPHEPAGMMGNIRVLTG